MCVGRRNSDNNSLVNFRTSDSNIYEQKKFENVIPIVDQHIIVSKNDFKEFKEDALAFMTQETKHVFNWINSQYQRFLKSALYK